MSVRGPALVLGGLAAVGLVVFAGVMTLGGPPAAEAEDFEVVDPRDDPRPRALPPGVSLDARGKHKRRVAGVKPEFYAGELRPGDENVTPEVAEAAFANALAELDQILIDKKRLGPQEFQEINRWANDAFAGWQIHLDGNEPGDRAQLDAAHRQLATRLSKLRKRVRQKPGERQLMQP